MSKKQYILFDLDGTLTDPQEGITKSVAYALDKFGIQVEDRTSLNKFIGPPLIDSFMEYFHFTEDQAEEAVWKYREYFSDRGIFENKIYPGIPELLCKLQSEGRTLLLATSKPTVYAKQILEKFSIDQYFTDIQGSNLDGTRVKKAEVVAYVMKQNGIVAPAEAVMVGDRKHDIIGAKECGMSSIGVLYGYGSREELVACKADRIAGDVQELLGILG